MLWAATACLACDKHVGQVNLQGTFNLCPRFTSIAVAPVAVRPGGEIRLSAVAADPDATKLTFRWRATAGQFQDASAPNTTYTCPVGIQVLQVKVSDGECGDTGAVRVACNSSLCGDGKVDPDQGEECDPPNQATCDSTCSPVSPCRTCEDGACDPQQAGCAGLTGPRLQSCTALVACIRSSGCAAGGDFGTCYCGHANAPQCAAGRGNGLCKSQIEAAAESKDPRDVLARFDVAEFPAARRAINLIRCDLAECEQTCTPPPSP